MSRAQYLRRILAAYILSNNSQLSFWHEVPAVNDAAFTDDLGQYYMTFAQKAHYPGPFDDNGVPLLDYHGQVGRQYNPIAIAQYALANYNLYQVSKNKSYLDKFFRNATWLLDNLMATPHGTFLWPHHFDFEYFRPLIAPWFSGLAQGQGLSVLVRAFAQTGEARFEMAAAEVFRSLSLEIKEGGVLYKDRRNHIWIEEYQVDPPTHVLNGFIWALWGLYDCYLLTRSEEAKGLFATCTSTILAHLPDYDAGFWSYYELTPGRIKSPASAYYHQLHVVQLEVMHRLTKQPEFARYAEKWRSYSRNLVYRGLAIAYKIPFKLMYY